MTGNGLALVQSLPSRSVRRRRVAYVFVGYFIILVAALLRATPGAASWLWQSLLAVGVLSLLSGLVYLLGARRSLLPEAQFHQASGHQGSGHQGSGQHASGQPCPRLSERQWRLLVAAQMNADRILGGLAVLLCLVYWGFLPASARLLDTDSLGLLLLAGALLLIPNLPNALLAWTLDERDVAET